MQPELLRADNFTPPTRTPWGGRKIVDKYKASLGVAPAGAIVGESWEVSIEPSFPSRLAADDRLLADVLASDPIGWLGPEVAERHGGQTPLLVKLLDAADELSVQVHPADGAPLLTAGESGKPESWIILEAEPGAGLYLGFRQGVERSTVEQCIRDRGALDELLNFVPVVGGEVFQIQAGTAHAIGRGVTLVEPQFVVPGQRGITYRFWDWNRRYDPAGRLDPNGASRPLHLEQSLEVTDWAGPRGAELVAACRPAPRVLDDAGLRRTLLVDWPWFLVEHWSGTGQLLVPAAETMTALTCVGGRAAVRSSGDEVLLRAGQSGVVPSVAGALRVQAEELSLFATRSRLAADGGGSG